MTTPMHLSIVIRSTMTGQKAFSQTNRSMEQLGHTTKMLTSYLMVMATYAALSFLKQGVDNLIEFETEMGRLNAIMQVQGSEFENLKNSVKDVADTYKYSYKEVATASYYAASAGFTETEALTNVTSVASKLALSGYGGLVETTKALTSATNAFNYSAQDTELVANVLSYTIKRGTLTMDDIAQSIGKIAPAAAMTGQSLKDMGAIWSFLTHKGVEPAVAATSLGRVFESLLDPKVLEQMREFGIAYSSMTQADVDSSETLRDLVNVLNGYEISLASTTENLKKYNEEYNKLDTQINSINVVIEGQEDKISKLGDEYNKVTSIITAFSDKMNEISLEEQANRIKIMEIRLRADKQGRKLNSMELQQIEKLELANEEYSLSTEKLSYEMNKQRIIERDITRDMKNEENALSKLNDTKNDYEKQLDVIDKNIIDSTKSQEEYQDAIKDGKLQMDEYVATLGKFLPIPEIINNINDAFTGMSDIQRSLNVAEVFPNARALRAVALMLSEMGLMNEYFGDFNKISATSGELTEAHTAFMTDFVEEMRKWIHEWEKVRTKLAEKVWPTLKLVLDTLILIMGVISKAPEILLIVGGLIILTKFMNAYAAAAGRAAVAQAAAMGGAPAAGKMAGMLGVGLGGLATVAAIGGAYGGVKLAQYGAKEDSTLTELGGWMATGAFIGGILGNAIPIPGVGWLVGAGVGGAIGGVAFGVKELGEWAGWWGGDEKEKEKYDVVPDYLTTQQQTELRKERYYAQNPNERGTYGDFIWRAGQAPIRFSPNDNLIASTGGVGESTYITIDSISITVDSEATGKSILDSLQDAINERRRMVGENGILREER